MYKKRPEDKEEKAEVREEVKSVPAEHSEISDAGAISSDAASKLWT